MQDQRSFTDVDVLNGSPVKYTLWQVGGVDQFVVNVSVLGSRVGEDIINRLRSHLTHVLGLEDDLRLFYRTFAEDEPLNLTFSKLRGLRLMRGTDPYESLIFSILSQNSSARKMNRSARLLMQHYGSKVLLADGSSHFLFPTAETLAKSTVRELRERAAVGYRAKSIVEVSKRVHSNAVHLDQIALLPYEKAMEVLLELPGVGPKVADCFLLYGLGRLEAAPVDVWIHRIVSKSYFEARNISKPMVARFLRQRFAQWAGYAQLYLFDYARRGIPATNFG
jgi:N-glycosylase/DNA lyase